MMNNERIKKLKEIKNNLSIKKKENKRKTFIEYYRNEEIMNFSFSSCSSSLNSNESLNQTILFLSTGKLYRKYFSWVEINKEDCEVIRNNQTSVNFTFVFLGFL